MIYYHTATITINVRIVITELFGYTKLFHFDQHGYFYNGSHEHTNRRKQCSAHFPDAFTQ